MPRPNTDLGMTGAEWLQAHVGHQGDECLFWPLARNWNGHGQVGIEGKILRAHRVMCEWVNGPAPSPSHEAAHSCGNGHKGCVHPRHLSWKTRSGNQQDRYVHDRKPRKDRRWKLTPAQVAEIRSLEGTKTQTALAVQFGVSRGTIHDVLAGISWRFGNYDNGNATKRARGLIR